MTARPSSLTLRIVLLSALMATLVTPVEAQWMVPPPPVDSPYWWTLTDEVSPQELRVALTNPAAVRQRYLAAKEAEGVTVPPVELTQIDYFITGRLTPELFPMFDAYITLAVQTYHEPGEERTRELLALYAFSPASADKVISSLLNYMEKRDAAVAEVAPRHQELMEIVRRSRVPLKEAFKRGDIDRVVAATGASRDRVAELFPLWNAAPSIETALDSLSSLRQELSEQEWENLRRLLLEEIAPYMSILDIESEG